VEDTSLWEDGWEQQMRPDTLSLAR